MSGLACALLAPTLASAVEEVYLLLVVCRQNTTSRRAYTTIRSMIRMHLSLREMPYQPGSMVELVVVSGMPGMRKGRRTDRIRGLCNRPNVFSLKSC